MSDIGPQLSEISETLLEIAGYLKPQEQQNSPDVSKALMAGVASGFADQLTQILDDPELDTMKKARELRTLAAKARQIAEKWSVEQGKIDQAYVKSQKTKDSVWSGDGN